MPTVICELPVGFLPGRGCTVLTVQGRKGRQQTGGTYPDHVARAGMTPKLQGQPPEPTLQGYGWSLQAASCVPQLDLTGSDSF